MVKKKLEFDLDPESDPEIPVKKDPDPDPEISSKSDLGIIFSDLTHSLEH